MFRILIIFIINFYSLFGNERSRDIDEITPKENQLIKMIHKKKLKEDNIFFENIILSELINYGQNQPFFLNKKNSEIIHKMQYKYEINKNEVLFLFASSIKDFDCHACIPKMNWFYFKKEESQWKLLSKIINREFYLGSWGDLTTPDLIKIGKNDIAFKYISSYSQGGYTNTSLLVEGFKNGRFTNIIKEDFAFDDTGKYEENEEHNNWQGTLSIINKNKKHYDLLIEKEDLKI